MSSGREALMWLNRIGLSSVLRPRQHSVGYLVDGFYRSKDPTNTIKVLKKHIVAETTEVVVW